MTTQNLNCRFQVILSVIEKFRSISFALYIKAITWNSPGRKCRSFRASSDLSLWPETQSLDIWGEDPSRTQRFTLDIKVPNSTKNRITLQPKGPVKLIFRVKIAT